MSRKATIYTKDDCPHCVNAKIILTDHDIDYIELHYNKDFNKGHLIDILPEDRKEKITLPQIWLDGNYVGGCSDLVSFFEREQS